MIALLFTSPGYRLLGLLHILAVVAAFGPLLVYPHLRRHGELTVIATLHMRLTFPSLVALWVFGMGMAGVGELKMSQLWLSLSLLVWVVLMAASWFLIRPATSDDGEVATRRFSAGVGVTHLGLAVGLVLMIWKPGL